MTKVAIVPIYNEAATLEKVLASFSERIDVIIAVNDGSTDDSSAILGRWVQSQPRAYVIDNAINRGKASALKDGFALAAVLLDEGFLAQDDMLFTFDADGQHTVDSVDELASRAGRERLDMLLTRRDFSHYPRFKKVGNWGLSMFASLLGGYRFKDVECGLRVIRMGRIPEILAYYIGYKYSSEQELGIITASLGFRIDNDVLVEVPHYRAGTKIPDGLVNISLGLLTWLRLHLGLRTGMETVRARLARRRVLAGTTAPLPRSFAGSPRPAAPRSGAAPEVAIKLDR